MGNGKACQETRRDELLARLLSHTAPYALPGETCVDTAIRLLDARQAEIQRLKDKVV